MSNNPEVKNPEVKNFKIVEKYKIWYTISAAIFAVGIIFAIVFGCIGQGVFNLGIDFTGGTNLSVTIGNEFNDENVKKQVVDYVEEQLGELGVQGHDPIQYTGSGLSAGLSVTFGTLADKELSEVTEFFTDTESETGFYQGLVAILGTDYDTTNLQISPQSISAKASSNLLQTTILSLVIAVFLILVYITIRFEMLSGFIAVLALVHDTLIVCAFMAILRIPVNAPFIAALITIIGYSINATIVIFDRIRENCKKLSLKQFSAHDIANLSIRETMTRSINTTITTLFTIVVLACFPIPDMQYFAIPIIIGLLAGTFSSVFLAGTSWALIRDYRDKKKARSDYQLANNK